MKPSVAITLITLSVLSAPWARAADDKASLALKARQILNDRCIRCHQGKESTAGRFDAADPKSIVEGVDKTNKPVVVSGKPHESPMWEVIDSGSMPDKDSDEAKAMTSDDRNLLKKWVEQGAPAWPVEKPPRTPIGITQMLAAIRDDLRKAPDLDQPYLRYYTLNHLYNQPRISDIDLDRYRAALCKAINSLSWKYRLVIPRPIDPEKTILSIDLRDLDWDVNDLWKYVLAEYPYGLTYDSHSDGAYRQPYLEIKKLSGTPLPYIRADWFVSTATRAPLYNALLQIPDNADAIEARLGVNLIANFQRGRLERAGFGNSGVSPQANRMVERHDCITGGYWRSYDFRAGLERSHLPEFPLGPEFKDNPFANQAFRQAGGEIIFNLPNGLQGYMLVDGNGKRIDTAPDFVVDPEQTSGSAAIVNGLSCMACHDEGMKKGFTDEIRLAAAVGGDAQVKVQQLYPPANVMTARIEEASTRFLDAQRKALAPFLKEPDKTKKTDEPIRRINQYYRRNRIGAEAAAAELGLENASVLAGAIRGNPNLRRLGLGPLANGGTINRTDWEKITGNSIFQRAARELELGTPFRGLVSGYSGQ
jgi:mono/diheme cytochrome c family protein